MAPLQWGPEWFRNYSRRDLAFDATAGLVVASVLVPQAMAYAVVAGLPPQVGLYASVLPLIAYAVFARGGVLSMGPVAVVSLMVASAVGTIAEPGTTTHIQAAVALALLTGACLVVMGLLRLGGLARFLSRPVLTGFLGAAALIIAYQQVSHLVGLPAGWAITDGWVGLHPAAATIGITSIVVLLVFQTWVPWLLERAGASGLPAQLLARGGPLVVVAGGGVAAALLGLEARTALPVVGHIPAGLPELGVPLPDLELWQALAVPAILIAVVGFVESMSVAQTLAAKRRQRTDPDRELVAQGAANVVAGCSGGFPVSGGVARTVVNHAAGAQTPMAGVITALLIAGVLLTLTPALYHLPRASLAAVIIVAVLGLVDWRAAWRIWRYDMADGLSMAATAAAVLLVGLEAGILVGVATSLALVLRRSSRPHVAVLGRVPGTEHYRNVERFEVMTSPTVVAVRVDESLYFPNTRYLEDRLLTLVAERRQVRHLVVICTGVNAVDASALETLEGLAYRLHDAGVTLHLAEVKGPVMDRLQRVDFPARLAPGRIFLSTDEAMRTLDPQTYG